jgi:fibronectin-binding autotransporter adhesin
MYQTIWSLGGCRSFGRVYLRALGRLAAGSGSEGLSEAEPIGLSGPGVPGTPIAPPSGRPKSPQYPARRKASGLLAGPCLLALLLVAFFTVCLCPPAWSQTIYTWQRYDSDGNWNDPTNWNPSSGYPNSASDIAIFPMQTTDHRNVTLGANITVNQIQMTNTGTHRLEVGPSGTSYTITFAGTSPQISSTAGAGGDAALRLHARVIVDNGLTKTGTGSAAFMNGLQGTGDVSFNGGTVEIRGNSPNFSGNLIVNSGAILQARSTPYLNILGDTTGQTIVNQGGWFMFRDFSSSVTISEPFVINGVYSRGSLHCYAGNATINGPITLNANGSFGVRDWASAEPGNTRIFTINSIINDNGTGKNVYFLGDYQDSSGRYSNARKNVIVLGAQNSYRGNTYITSNYHDASNPFTGNVRLGTNNALPTTTKVILGGTHDAGGGVYIGIAEGNGKLILGGYNQELAGLETAGTGTANRVVGGSSTQSTLTLNIPAATTNTFAGVLGGPDANENNLALYKKGEGTLILTGQNTYTGRTTVAAGTLILQGGDNRLDPNSQLYMLSSTEGGGNATVEFRSNQTFNPWIRVPGTNTVKLGDGVTLTVNSGDFWPGSFVQGTGKLVKAGTGLWTFGSTASHTGGTEIQAGTFAIYTTGQMPSTGDVLVATGATWDLDYYNEGSKTRTIDELSGAGTITIGTAGTAPVDPTRIATLVVGNGNGSSTFSGLIEDGKGKIALTKTGTGTFTLSGANTYTGTTTVSQGVLKITHPNALGATGADQGTTVANYASVEVEGGITVNEPITLTGGGHPPDTPWYGALRSTGGNNTWAGPITLNGGARIGVRTNETFTITGGITGTGSPAFCGTASGTIRIATNPINVGTSGSLYAIDNTTTLLEVAGNVWKDTYISYGGTLKLGVDNPLPSTTVVTIGNTPDKAGTFDLNGYSQTIGGLQDAGSGNRRVINSGAGASTLTINNTANYTFAGVIQGNINLVKQGTGTQTLSGQNTYTGTTEVLAGTLALVRSGSNNNISGSSAIRIGSGATLNVTGLAGSLLRLATGQTLQGNGTVQGNVEAPAGSFLAAGMSPGHLTITGNYTQAGTLLVELAGYQQGGTQALPGQWQTNGYDWVSVGGTAVLDGYLNIQLLAGFQPASGDVFNVLTAAGGITDQGLDLLWQPGSLLPGQYWTYRIVAGQGGPNEQILQLQLGVPEPASGLLAGLALGALGLWLLRRRFGR